MRPSPRHEISAFHPSRFRRRRGVLLPFDMRPDREGWTVVEVATDQAASLDGMTLVGLSLEDAETIVNCFNALHRRLCRAIQGSGRPGPPRPPSRPPLSVHLVS